MVSDRSSFVRLLGGILAEWGAGSEDELTASFAAELEDASDAELAETVGRVATTGGDWGHHPGDPIARRVSRLTMERVLEPASAVDGDEALKTAASRPVVFLGNHLSFVDVNVLDYLFAMAGHGDTAEKLSVVVGPKVYAKPIRRLASLCFGTIKIPQSTARASGEAVMSPREVAKLARRMLDAVMQRQQLGEHLLVFPEGTRSRDGAMQRCLAAVVRYVEHPDALIVPFGLWGTEKLVPIEEDHVYPTTCLARLGKPIEASELIERSGRKRGVAADAIGFLVADLLPESYRGAYERASEELEPARRLADSLSS